MKKFNSLVALLGFTFLAMMFFDTVKVWYAPLPLTATLEIPAYPHIAVFYQAPLPAVTITPQLSTGLSITLPDLMDLAPEPCTQIDRVWLHQPDHGNPVPHSAFTPDPTGGII